MPIPNVSTLYQRLAKGSEAGHEFARFMNLLLLSEYESQKSNYIITSDASGDYKGVDSIEYRKEIFKEFFRGFQFKFYPGNLTSQHKKDIIKSLENALNNSPHIQEWILVTPEDFQKSQRTWFENVQANYEGDRGWVDIDIGSFHSRFKMTHWGHTKIVELCLRHEHIGRQYFPELFPSQTGILKLATIQIDSQQCNWEKSSNSQYTFYQHFSDDNDTNKITDPVIDFHFKNSTNEIYLLNKIEVVIEKMWSTLKGLPSDEVLRSIGTIEYEVDFNKEINEILLPDPLIFESQKPKRFSIQLTNFTQNCHGNWANIKFWFYFDATTIPTPTITLSFP
jgi:hypothetical protein